jgi:hypothetical protein
VPKNSPDTARSAECVVVAPLVALQMDNIL